MYNNFKKNEPEKDSCPEADYGRWMLFRETTHPLLMNTNLPINLSPSTSYRYTSPNTSPERDENHNGSTSYSNLRRSPPMTPTGTLSWERFLGLGGPVRRISESSYYDSDNSNPRSLSSPEDLTRPLSSLSFYNSVEQPGPSGMRSQPGPSGMRSQHGPSGMRSQYGSSGIRIQSGPSGMSSQPGPSGMSSQPGPSGMSSQPGPSWMSSQPGPSWMSSQPGPSWMSSQPGPSGMSSQPGPSGMSSQPGPSGMKSPTTKIALLKEKNRRKRAKKEMNEMERILQNMPSTSSSQPLYQRRELSQSPVPSTSSMGNFYQEQSTSTNLCQDGVNLTRSNNVRTPTSTNNNLLYMKKRTSRKVKYNDNKLTQEAYETRPGYKVPRCVKGKFSTHKCKYCAREFLTKHELWIHYRQHLPPHKRYECPEPYCAFVTNLKHHLTYHRLSHLGLKPYTCRLCPYTGTNKAMVKSHEKMHSDFYFYTCKDCVYGNKYLNILKRHLKKKGHRPGRAFDLDGNEIEQVIDVHGRKRGPRTKTTVKAVKTAKTVKTVKTVRAVKTVKAVRTVKPRRVNRKQKETVNEPSTSSQCLSDNLLQENLVEAQNLGQMNIQSGSISPIVEHYNANSLYLQSLLASMPSTSGTQMGPSTSSANIPLDLSLLLAMQIFSTTNSTAVPNSTETSPHEVEEPQALNLSMRDSHNNSSNSGQSSGAGKRKGKTIIKYVKKPE